MKLFWSLIAIIVFGAAAYLAVGMLSGPAALPESDPAPPPPAAGTAPRPASAPAREPVAASPTESAPARPPIAPVPEVASHASAEQPLGAVPPSDQAADPANADAVPAKAAPVEPAKPDPQPADPPVARGTTQLTKDELEAKAALVAQSANPDPAPGDPPAAEPAAAPDLPAAEVKVEKREDGSLLIDGKYIVTGEGTKAKPFKLTWDLLVSVAHDYSPRDGKKFLPGRITMFDGTWVEMTGYVAFPIMSDQSDELLSMMNQWDGCCIGVPPTPYDAIEVRLTSPVSGPARFTSYGTVAGKLKVEPSLVGTWVVGLYVMDNATMTPKAIGGTNP